MLNTFTTLSTGEREGVYSRIPFLYCAYVIGLDLEKTWNKSLKIITHGSFVCGCMNLIRNKK